MTTAFYYSPVFLEHLAGPHHPERPERLVSILETLSSSHILETCLQKEPGPATIEAVAAVHDPNYIAHIERQCSLGRHFNEDPDTFGSSGTYLSALTAAGAAVESTDLVMNKQVINAFCAVRPPGHHAEHSAATGFCFFNNIAIAARHIIDQHGLDRVAIIDWDVHHGNGTQHTFYSSPSVLYCSLHQYPHFPGSGRKSETGQGAGTGSTLNVPLAAGCGDADYLNAFRSLIVPAIDRFKPQFILVSAGFDAHADDPLSGMFVSTSGFAEMTRLTLEAAYRHCDGRLVSFLEGGYDLAALASSVAAHLKLLTGSFSV
jgi:acetoin utilization deacetylase AcuC-like enzyme